MDSAELISGDRQSGDLVSNEPGISGRFALNKTPSSGQNKKSDVLSKSEWVTKVFESNPDIKNLKERVSPLSRSLCFSDHYRGQSVTPHESILQLIMQYFEHEGLKPSLKALESESNVHYEPHITDDCRLITLIMTAIKDVEQLWDISIGHSGDDEIGDEILYDILSSFNILPDSGLELTDVNIWDEPQDNLVYEEGSTEKLIFCASLNRLVELLTPAGIVDSVLLQAFMTTYTLFTTPKILLKKLKERYNVPTERSEGLIRQKLPIQVRVINLIKLWIEEYRDDFDEILVNDLRAFLALEVKQDHPIQSQLLIDSLDTFGLTKSSILLDSSTGSKEPRPIVPKNIFSPTLTWEDIDDEEIARQLTLIEFSYYKEIKTTELLSQSWSKEKLKHRAPHVLQVINRFNEVSQWVGSTIVTTQRIKDRSKILGKLINIADHLRKLNNFSTLMAFVAVFNSAAIHRLKHTFSELSPSTHDQLSELRKIVDSENGYKHYKATLESTPPPCIPYLGIYLTDLVFTEEANEQFVNGLINFRKSRSLHSIISRIKTFQRVGYNLQTVHQIQSLLLNLHPRIDDKLVFKYSCIIEPRGIDKAGCQ